MAEKSQVHKIPKLNHDNYSAWAFRAELLLKAEGAWNVITEEPPIPDDSDASRAQVAAWNANQLKGKSIIGLAVEDSQLIYIKKCSTARLCWEALKTHHKLPTLGARLQLYDQIFSEKLHHQGSMREHIGKLRTWYDDLAEMDSPLPDDIAVGVLLTSVNKVYKNLVTAVGAWSDDRLTLQSVKAKLMEEDNKRRSSEAQRGGASEISQRPNPYENSRNTEAARRSSEAPSRYWGGTQRGFEGTSRSFSGNPRFNSEARYNNDQSEAARNSNDYSEASRRNAQSSQEGFLCHNCGQPGHFRSNCPKGRGRFDLRQKLNAKRRK